MNTEGTRVTTLAYVILGAGVELLDFELLPFNKSLNAVPVSVTLRDNRGGVLGEEGAAKREATNTRNARNKNNDTGNGNGKDTETAYKRNNMTHSNHSNHLNHAVSFDVLVARPHGKRIPDSTFGGHAKVRTVLSWTVLVRTSGTEIRARGDASG